MKNENDEIRRMYEIEAQYTLLIFYAPDCGHCNKVVPKVKKVLDSLPKLKFGDFVDPKKNTRVEKDKKEDLDNAFYHLQEKSDAKYMFLIAITDINAGEEIKANYNLYTYPKTGVGVQTF